MNTIRKIPRALGVQNEIKLDKNRQEKLTNQLKKIEMVSAKILIIPDGQINSYTKANANTRVTPLNMNWTPALPKSCAIQKRK